ncbi:unnamed protein product [Ambrosiozyma monospora]|uniref:Unnamed protein product n=1 Tax=Ambrosiozyma monospora TaxID=43982 RepID=A0ACB5T3K3_AMBMO|nr:unnamed protein product [Ambrosiozyma monospora]
MTSKNGFQLFHDVFDFVLDKEPVKEARKHDLVVLGQTYASLSEDQVSDVEQTNKSATSETAYTSPVSKDSPSEDKSQDKSQDQSQDQSEDRLKETIQTDINPEQPSTQQQDAFNQFAQLKLNEIKSFFQRVTSNNVTNPEKAPPAENTFSLISRGGAEWPADFLCDVDTRIWLTYRAGFPLIEKSPDGPSPLSFGSLLRGTLDLI